MSSNIQNNTVMKDDDGSNNKRRKINGPAELISWAERNFYPLDNTKHFAISPNITAFHVLKLVGKFVFTNSSIDALKFVTCWLEQDHPNERLRSLSENQYNNNNSIPSLSHLCTQRIAAEIFPSLVIKPKTNKNNIYISYEYVIVLSNFDGTNLDEIHEFLLSKRMKEYGVPEHLQECVLEEIHIFIIVYMMFIDLYRYTFGEDGYKSRSDLLLPMDLTDQDIAGNIDWWDDWGIDLIMNSVPNTGRGSLAKIGLLPHAILTSCLITDTEPFDIYSHVHRYVIRSLIDDRQIEYFHSQNVIHVDDYVSTASSLIVNHPLSYSIALPSIVAYFNGCTCNINWRNDSRDDFEKGGEPIFRKILCDLNNNDKYLVPTPYSLLLSLSNDMKLETIRAIQKAPLQISMTLQDSIVQYLHTLELHNLLDGGDKSNNDHDGDLYENDWYDYDVQEDTAEVTRLRLTGNHSKEYMLKCAISCRRMGTTVLDLRGISNRLDEECLCTMLLHMKKVKTVLLHGVTSIDEKICASIRNTLQKEEVRYIKQKTRRRTIRFEFRADMCTYCGNGPVTEQFTTPREVELEAENKQLRDELRNLKREMNELKIKK